MFKTDENFDENAYVKVNERIQEFWKLYPNGRINTFVTEIPTGFLVRAIVCKDQNDAQEFGLTSLAPATGHAFLPKELLGEKVLEFSETVSIGRALAILGFKIEKSIASEDEMVRWKENKDSGTEPDKTGEAGQPQEETPSPKLKPVSRFNLNKLKKE